MRRPAVALIGAQRRDQARVQRDLAGFAELPDDGEYAVLDIDIDIDVVIVKTDRLTDPQAFSRGRQSVA